MHYVGPRGIALDEFLTWPQHSQDSALSWAGHEAQRCPGCGQHKDDPPRHFHVEICLTCKALAAASKEATEQPGGHAVAYRGAVGDPMCPRCNPRPSARP